MRKENFVNLRSMYRWENEKNSYQGEKIKSSLYNVKSIELLLSHLSFKKELDFLLVFSKDRADK